MPRLIIRDNTGDEIFDMIEDEIIAGRAKDNLLHIDDDGLSRQHFRVFLDGNCYRIEDLGSKNGTLVNASKIKEPHRLRGGDIIGVREVEIEFQWLPGEKDNFEETIDDDDQEDLMDTGPNPVATEDALEALDSRQAKGQRFRLTIMSESQSFLEHHFDNETITIGRRSDRVITIKDEAASGNHAELIPDGDGYRLVDESSRNGTFIKGKKVQNYALESGDVIRIGKTELRFVDLDSPLSDAHEEVQTKPEKKPKPERNGSPDTDSIPVCNGDTQELPRAEDVEHWRNAKAKSGVEEDDDLNNLFGGDSASQAHDQKTTTEAQLATDSGPVTNMVKRGMVEEEVLNKDEDEHDTDDSEKQVVQLKRVKPKPHPKHDHPHHHHHHRPASVLPTILASLVALAIVCGAAYFLFAKDKAKTVNPKVATTETTGSSATVTRPDSGEGAPNLISTVQVAMWKSPLPDLPELKSEIEASAVGDDIQNEGGEGMAGDESVVRARPLNSTRRGKNYGSILSDLIQDVSVQNQAESLGDEDLGHLARAKELLREFKLSMARRELEAMTKKDWDYKSALEQLKIISSIIGHMDDTFASGKIKISLKQVAKSASSDGPLVGTSNNGIIFRNTEGEPAELNWADLKPAEKYFAAQSCYSKSDAAARANLGILCLNIGLTSEAKTEFQTAEKLGFKDIDRFRALLEREPESLK
ncbi:MAG: FHA domain-containing protein [Planctomycetota bacterium]|nr:FHA domain-containing protein [Planctomycetota bacterium]